MSETKDGGPAFPPFHNPKNHESGMTLRDYAAVQFMAAQIQQGSVKIAYGFFEDAAHYAFKAADAFLAAREATHG